ncbi:MAG TPA: polysaccharide deacetylase family protein [Azonexus sp.]|nr:polysaccharide deacetylase family protein [Azonexus sp.]
MLWKPLLRLLAGTGAKQKLQVFIFHRIPSRADELLPGEPSAEQFDWMVAFISRNYKVMTFGEATALLKSGMLPPATACITFDDGYLDNATVAYPILKKYGVPATFFIATSFTGGGRMWNDDIIESVRNTKTDTIDLDRFGLGIHPTDTMAARKQTIQNILQSLKYRPHAERQITAAEIAKLSDLSDQPNLMMSREDIQMLANGGMEIGAHTHTHPILHSLPDEEAEYEIVHGKTELEALLDKPVHSFAYPNGNTRTDMRQVHLRIIEKAGFRAAATTDWGVATIDTNPYLIPRYTPWDRTPNRFALRCALSLAKPAAEPVLVP